MINAASAGLRGEMAISKNKIFDVVVIGAGPAAVAALAAIDQGVSVCVITGAESAGRVSHPNLLHSKIVSVSHERKEAPGVARDLPFSGKAKSAAFDTAAAGGLANYWGQQFVRYTRMDPWPRQVFPSYEDYLAACAHIESLFLSTPGPDRSVGELQSSSGVSYDAFTPNLMVGTPSSPEAGLRAMEIALTTRISALCAERRDGAAVRIVQGDGVVEITLDDGERVRGAKVLVAAGVVGSLRLIMQSCSEVRGVQFSDHAPYMAFLMRRPGALNLARADGLKHFNALTIERHESGLTSLFASIYRMSHASVGLLLASLGMPPLLPRVKPPWLVDLVVPVQIWTASTVVRCQLDHGTTKARSSDSPATANDKVYQDFVTLLTKTGILLGSSTTPPGFGFHYYDGRITQDNVDYEPVGLFVDKHFNGLVKVVDASTLPQIGTRPPALTAMAAAYANTRLFQN